jgi:hypothetical protein
MGAVSFLHRSGSSLNPHCHFHLCLVDGPFEKLKADTVQDAANSVTRHRYHGVFAPNAPLRPLVTARAKEDD